MRIQATRAQRKHLETENQRQPRTMQVVPRETWPPFPPEQLPAQVWRSRDYLAQLYVCWAPDARAEGMRLSVCRTRLGPNGRWEDGLTWDELQAVKTQCGYGSDWAIEIYPPDANVVNDANMRHLWLIENSEVPEWAGWKRGNSDGQAHG